MKEVDKGVDKMTAKKTENSTPKDADIVCENGKKKGRSERLPTKVVVRRLPPTMTKETFLQQCSPIPPVDYLYFVQADMTLAPHCFSRAYLNFVNHQDIFTFTQKFDNYVFVDAKGQEYPAVVEFAPFQRIPKRRPNRKKDPKMGTLESSPIYISFKEKLETEMQENKTSANAIKQHFFETSASGEEKKEVASTPLLDFIKTRKAERQRIRDEKREEKRKRDLERRRVKDEMRKLKKDEESPVVKCNSVLPESDQAMSKVTVVAQPSKETVTVSHCPENVDTKQENCPNKTFLNETLLKTDTSDPNPDPNMPKAAAVDSAYQAILDGCNTVDTVELKERKLNKIKEKLFLAMAEQPVKNVSDLCNESVIENTETPFASDIVKMRKDLNDLLTKLSKTDNLLVNIISSRNTAVIDAEHNNKNKINDNLFTKSGQNQESHETGQEISDVKSKTTIETNVQLTELMKTICPLSCDKSSRQNPLDTSSNQSPCDTFNKQSQSCKNPDDSILLNNSSKAKETYENGKVQILKPFRRTETKNGSKETTASDNSNISQIKCILQQTNGASDNLKRSSSRSRLRGSDVSPQKQSIPDKIFSPQQILSYNSKLRKLHSSGLLKMLPLIENSKCESVQNSMSADETTSSVAVSKSVVDKPEDKKPVLDSYEVDNRVKRPILKACTNKLVANEADEIGCKVNPCTAATKSVGGSIEDKNPVLNSCTTKLVTNKPDEDSYKIDSCVAVTKAEVDNRVKRPILKSCINNLVVNKVDEVSCKVNPSVAVTKFVGTNIEDKNPVLNSCTTMLVTNKADEASCKIDSSVAVTKPEVDNRVKRPILKTCIDNLVVNKVDEVSCTQEVVRENWKNSCTTLPRRPHTFTRKIYVTSKSWKSSKV